METVMAKVHDYSAQTLADRSLNRRAVEAAIWGIPAVNYNLMFQEMVRTTGGTFNQILWWPRLLTWKNQTLTPNGDVIYLMPFFNTKDVGPLVLEVPPADEGLFNGSIMNYWQAAIEDIGPGGLDKGKGGKYAILPPGFPIGDLPDGYIPMPLDTYQGYALVRSVLRSGSDADVAKAVAYGARLKLYPLSRAANPPQTAFVDPGDQVFDSTIPYDLRFFRSLDDMVQAEPWLERDRAMIDVLRTIGISQGEKFDPDPKTIEVLEDALRETRAWFDARYDGLPPFYEGKHWFFPVTEEMHQSVMSRWGAPDSYPIDARGTAYSLAFFSGMHVGQTQYYLLCGRDADGAPLSGAATYRLNVPAEAPASQYWSVTAYNRDNHAFIRNVARVSRSSQSPGLQPNPDGSVDLYFGPKAPSGQEANWTPTDATGKFEVLARFYGPLPALFDRSWQLGDLERLG